MVMSNDIGKLRNFTCLYYHMRSGNTIATDASSSLDFGLNMETIIGHDEDDSERLKPPLRVCNLHKAV